MKAFLECDDYNCAKEMLLNENTLTGVYFILAGMKPNEGCVISNQEEYEHIDELSDDRWYIVQTN